MKLLRLSPRLIFWLLFYFGALTLCLCVLDLPTGRALQAYDNETLPFFRFFAFFERAGHGEFYYVPLALIAAGSWLTSRRLSGEAQAERRKLFHQSSFVLLVMAASGILLTLLKHVFGRARPIMEARAGVFGFYPAMHGHDFESFPSGHANTVFTFAFAAGMVWPKLRLWFFLLALLSSLSRILLGQHYPGDILGSLGLAFLCTIIGARLYAQHYKDWAALPRR